MGSLTSDQIETLAKKMKVPLAFCDFKDLLSTQKLQYNKLYIINMEDEYDENGRPNSGSLWTCFQSNKYPNGKVENIYLYNYWNFMCPK